jgi:hypothetical protein
VIIDSRTLNGAIEQARSLGEALIEEPTLRTFAAYRRALTHVAVVLGTTDLAFARAVIVEDELHNYAYTRDAD